MLSSTYVSGIDDKKESIERCKSSLIGNERDKIVLEFTFDF